MNDGIVGDQTVAAINKFDEERFDKQFDRAELEYYNRLMQKNPRLKIYANGWRNRALAV